jgi:uncharacterized protein (TIGR03032 family)
MSTPKPAEPLGELRSVHTTSLADLLDQLRVSFLVSTYQAGKLIIVRADNGTINTHFRSFPSPMGIALNGGDLYLGTRTQVWQFYNHADVAQKLEPAGKHDACYLPRRAHFTGDIAIHEMAWASGELWIVNTRFSCLCTLAPDSSFVPRWRPPFITGLSVEDRCHLNGMCVIDGQVRYVTALGATNTAGGWRANKRNGGILMEVPSGKIIKTGLSMPHSPRWYGGKFWLLESGDGGLCTLDLATGELTTLVRVPGFTRGLDFYGPYAFVGLSQVRETAVFSGLPLTERLQERTCGVWVIDLRVNQIVGFLRFESGVQEIFAVQVLANQRFPDLLNEDENFITNSYVLPQSAIPDVAPAPIA